MPDQARPQPWASEPVTTVGYRRQYLDALQRPMKGSLTVSGVQRADTSDITVVSAPVVVPLVDGVFSVVLPPGEYTATGTLTTVDGQRADERSTFTVK